MRHHLFLAVLVGGSVAGCALAGERAASDDLCWGDCGPGCPSGETCSTDTPEGLYFGGAPTFDQLFSGGPGTMAVGGSQRISVLTSPSSAAWEELELPFDAKGTGVIAILETAPPQVLVRATGAGEGYLRIVQSGTDKLYDRVKLRSAKVTSVEVMPTIEAWVTPEIPQGGWALFSNGAVKLGVRLRGWDPSDALVDESMTLEVTGGVAELDTISHWDQIGVLPGATGKVTLLAKLGDGTAHTVTFPISEKIDEIEQVQLALSPTEATTVTVDRLRTFCFRAFDGDLAVAGLPWKFTSDANVEVEPQGSCVSVSSKVVGIHTITVEAAGQELALDFEVVTGVAGKPNKASLPPGAGESVAAPGERIELLSRIASGE